jgi:hypothetical protein
MVLKGTHLLFDRFERSRLVEVRVRKVLSVVASLVVVLGWVGVAPAAQVSVEEKGTLQTTPDTPNL